MILVAPKGSGTTVRRLFLEGKGINASFAIHQDATGKARKRALVLGIAIGSGYLFETTFQKEVFSDLSGGLDWFSQFREAAKPVFEELYRKVAEGEETRRVLEANSRSDYRQQLEKELKAVAESEMWEAGTVVRSLRPNAPPSRRVKGSANPFGFAQLPSQISLARLPNCHSATLPQRHSATPPQDMVGLVPRPALQYENRLSPISRSRILNSACIPSGSRLHSKYLPASVSPTNPAGLLMKPMFGSFSVMFSTKTTIVLAVVVLLGVSPARLHADGPSPADVEFFEKKVRPVFVAHCFKCHGNGKSKGGLSLASRDAMLKGGDSGSVVVPGQPAKSPLIQAIRYEGETQMPPKEKLSDRDIASLTAWIQRGAAWPAEVASADAIRSPGQAITAADRAFWSFRPIADPPTPAIKDKAWPLKPLDHFVLAKLEAGGLHPVRRADKHALLRRVTLDLTGLPPTPEEVQAFVRDASPDAFARVVDRLLASPRYGERWGRHWLDVARYGEDQAHTFAARLFPGGYRYRDWVVKALNDDMPYDRFIIEQIAGDLLKNGDPGEHLPALGFFALGPHYYEDGAARKLVQATELDDRIDTLTRGFLGLTVACGAATITSSIPFHRATTTRSPASSRARSIKKFRWGRPR